MTSSEFKNELIKLNKEGYNSCAYLISYNGETVVRTFATGAKVLHSYDCWFKKTICKLNGLKKEGSRFEEEYKNITDFLLQHWNDLDFQILETSKEFAFPRSRLRCLFEEIKPTLQPEHISGALERKTVGRGWYNGSYNRRVYRPRFYEDRRMKSEEKKRIVEEKTKPTMTKYNELIKRCHEEHDYIFEQTGGFITIALAAKIFNKSKNTVHLAITKKQLEATMVNHLWLITPFDLCQYACRREWF